MLAKRQLRDPLPCSSGAVILGNVHVFVICWSQPQLMSPRTKLGVPSSVSTPNYLPLSRISPADNQHIFLEF